MQQQAIASKGMFNWNLPIGFGPNFYVGERCVIPFTCLVLFTYSTLHMNEYGMIGMAICSMSSTLFLRNVAI